MAFAGFSPGEAEGLRRAMSRKRSAAAIEAYHQRFIDGAIAKQGDIDASLAERVWTMIVGFSGFGFPKAHGAAFGLLAYQSTWLRVHYGPEFLCALLDEQPMGFYPPDALIHEAQRRGIEILPPDVNESAAGCTVTQDGAVRLGLGYVLGVRADEVAALAAARDTDGPFRSLDDLASRAGACGSTLERLAWSGACDTLAGRPAATSRGEEFADVAGGATAAAAATAPGDDDAQADATVPTAEPPVLATDAATGELPSSARRTALWRLGIAAPAYGTGGDGTQMSLPLDLPQAPALAAMADWDAMIADYATTGLTVQRHPLRLLRPGLEARGTVRSGDLPRLRHGASVRIGGLVVARQRPGTANGVVFLLIEDETGTVNLIVPPRIYERDRLAVRTEPLILVDGTLERHASAGGAINVLVKRLTPLDAADLRTERPAATVKEFSPLDERERQRILEEQPLAAVGGSGAGGAVYGRPAARPGTLAAVAAGGSEINGRPATTVDATGPSGSTPRQRPARCEASPGAPVDRSDAGEAAASDAGATRPADGSELTDAANPPDGDRPPSERAVRAHGGAEDFRAVAPPVMSFTQGRRR